MVNLTQMKESAGYFFTLKKPEYAPAGESSYEAYQHIHCIEILR